MHVEDFIEKHWFIEQGRTRHDVAADGIPCTAGRCSAGSVLLDGTRLDTCEPRQSNRSL